MSDTPRSDDFIGPIVGIYMTEGEIAMCDFARQLERELNAAMDALKLCSAVIGAPNDEEWKSVDDCNAAFNAAQAVITKAKGEQP